MSKPSEPWAAVAPWAVTGLAPGEVQHLMRMAALERREQERLEAERAERAEDRREAWRMRRMQELAWRGIAFNPADDRTLAQPVEEFCAEVFRAQDAEDARSERRLLRSVGLLHDLGAFHVRDLAPPSASESRSAPVPPARSGMRAKVTEFLHRGGAVECMCAPCVSVRVARREGSEQ